MNYKLLTYSIVVIIMLNCKDTDDPLIVIPDSLEISLSTVDFNFSKDACLLKVTTNADWTVTKDADWISISANSGTGTTAFIVGAAENKQFKRNTTITIQSGKLTKELIINQSGANIISYTVNDISFSLILVEGGQFMMGDRSNSDFGLPHQVKLRDFYISETELTNELWKAVVKTLPYSEPNQHDYPVSETTWTDITDKFLPELNRMTGQTFRLPTEAEWEFAALGGNKTNGYIYAGSNTLDDVAWYAVNAGDKKHKVKEKLPNELGLYDMSGNVNEWCNDWFDTYYGFPIVDNVVYPPDLQTNPTGPTTGKERVIRGGNVDSEETWGFSFCNVKYRSYIHPSGYETYEGKLTDNLMVKNTGFRVVIAPL